MTDQKTELEELKTLQKESQKLRQRRKKSEPNVTPESEDATETVAQKASTDTEAQDEIDEGMSGQVATIMAELEETAAEHPGLALLAAFGIGILVGQLLTRR